MKRYRHSTHQRIKALSAGVMLLAPPLYAAIPIDIGVQRQLETTGQAHVLINLRDPVSIYANSATRVAAIAQVQASVYSQLTADHFQLKRQYSHIPALAGIITPYALNILQNNPQVVSIQLDSKTKTALAEGVPYVNGDQVQALPYTGKGITVAILDAGIDTDHPDLADAIVAHTVLPTGLVHPH
jgi:subtilisin family serine protease